MKTLQTKHGLISLKFEKRQPSHILIIVTSLLEDFIYIPLTFYVLMQKKMLEISIPTKSF